MGRVVPEYVLINQQSGYLASIRGRSTSDDATAIQYLPQLLETDGGFQRWQLDKVGDAYLIKNSNSGMVLGPNNAEVRDNNYLVQSKYQGFAYQQWLFELV